MYRLTTAVLVLFTALLSTSACTKQVRTAHYIPTAKPARNAVHEAMDRQVRNAVDAGEGDPVAQALRLRVSQDPGNLDARLRLAAHYRELGHPDLAAEHLRLAAERFADRADVQIALAKALREVDADASALKLLRTFVASHESAEAWSALGVMEDDLGSLTEAEAAHRRAVALQPTRASYRNNLGYNLLLQDKREDASAELRRALDLDRRNETARNNLAVALALDHPDEALAHWSSMSDPATARSNLAAVLIEYGKFAEARIQLASAFGYRKDHPAALRNLAILAELDGRPVEATAITKTDRSPRMLAQKMKQAIRGKNSAPTTAPAAKTASAGRFED